MKSLEIVNRNIKAIKKLLYKLKDVQEGTKEDFEKYYHEQELKDFKIIKQDLEILEIFKALMFHNIKSIGFKSSIKSYEALFNMGIITKEQLDKLKQWLEVN